MKNSKNSGYNSKGTCNCCGRPLTDRISVGLGIGPVCRVNKKNDELGEKTENMFANRASFDWGMTPDGRALYITDKGGFKSVTNDLENILADIMGEVSADTLRNTRIMYRDSMGIWDGIRLEFNGENLKGISFFPLTEKEFQPALTKLLQE